MRKVSGSTTIGIAAVVLAGLLALAGCSGSSALDDAISAAGKSSATKQPAKGGSGGLSDDELEAIAEEGAKQNGVDLDVDIESGEELPEEFPADVPVIEGTIKQSVRTVTDGVPLWLVTLTVDDYDAAMNDALTSLAAAGFNEDGKLEDDGLVMHSLVRDDYKIALSGYPDDSQVMYSVTQDKAE